MMIDWVGTVTKYRLPTAFALSLIVHLLLYGFWFWGKSLGLWDHQATWLLFKPKKKEVAVAPAVPPQQPSATQKEIPLTFMEVDPALASTEAPPDAKFYGAQNSVAANPEPNVETSEPKADGKQEQVPRTADVPKPLPFPLQPSVPPPEPQAQEAEKPTEVAKAITKDPNGIGAPPAEEKAVMPTRPRTVEEARRRLGLAGQKLKQDGSVQRRGTLSFDVKASEFGAYDAAFIAAVQKRWYDLLDSAQFAQRSGKVVLEFRLTHDGRITDMSMGNNEVGEILGLLCQRAVLDPAPYAAWPSDMRRKMGNYREVRFTFYYN